VTWNGSDEDGSALAAGVYWIRVTSSGAGAGATKASRSRAIRIVLLD
jgi:hypothetical protein